MTQSVPPADMPDDASASDHPSAAVDTLKLAMRRARLDDAERAGARAELRASRLGRLEMLQDALQPLVAQIPADADLFDIALVPSTDPRLFIDMIGFVEMARDARSYILNQDTRHGRIRVAESQSLEAMVDAVTDYVARRLLERDKALASDARSRAAGQWTEGRSAAKPMPQIGQEVRREAPVLPPPEIVPITARRFPRPLRWARIAFAFLIDLLGAITFFTILGAIGWYFWNRMHTPI